MKMIFCRLAKAGTQLPMPGQNRLFSERGETVDAEAPFWAVLINDGDIVEGAETPESETSSPSSPDHPATPDGGELSSPTGGEVAPKPASEKLARRK